MSTPPDPRDGAGPDGPPYDPAHRRLLRAVTELAGGEAEQGVDAARVAERAGVPVETFFEYFGDTQSSLLAAHDAWVEYGVRRSEQAGTSGAAAAPVAGVVSDVVSDLYDCLAERPDVARLCLVQVPRAGTRGRAARDRAVDRLRRVLEQRVALAGAPVPGAASTRLAAGGIYDTAQHYVGEGRPDELPAVAGDVARTWAGVLAGERPHD